MTALVPTYTISVDLKRKEVHYAASGLWDLPKMAEFQRDLLTQSKPLLEARTKFFTIGDLRGFVTQTRDVSDAMRVLIVESKKLGVVKSAIVLEDSLARMQYERLNEGINVEIFNNKAEAINWLRDKRVGI